ncbi:DUF6153 family protein [Streptomyces malaysiense]|uniref:Uncharacterized protein n=1 Tax=Streptomyces malaysiense TaxID=1428626 RepID=A0A1J4Q578_9ACTN|nr:hypothetical protein [Streptomyces malaysiense]OIK28293.1 hypothetical protein VT52_006370 [Streptomyces malaysiense]
MTDRRIGSRGGVARHAWAAVLALLAAFAVLVHHDLVAAPAASATAMSAMPATDRTAHRMSGRDLTETEVLNSAVDHDTGGACSGAGMQHCASGAVGSPQWLDPPTAPAHAVRPAPPRGVLAGRGLPGNPHRAPPDLSVLSRLLI